MIPIPLEKGWGEQNNQRIKKKSKSIHADYSPEKKKYECLKTRK